METHSVSKLLALYLVAFLFVGSELIQCTTVSYDKKAILINGRRKLLISGSIHYPRSTPEVYSSLSFSSLLLSGSFVILLKYLVILFVWILKWGVLIVADVGRSYTESQRWRVGCDWYLCFLEWSWTFSRQCTILDLLSLVASVKFQSWSFIFWFLIFILLICFDFWVCSTILRGDTILYGS